MSSNRRTVKKSRKNSPRSFTEGLESRLLMAVQPLSTSVPQISANKTVVAFNSVATGKTGAGSSRVESVTITDTGSSSLNLGGFSIIDKAGFSNSANFTITNSGSLPSTLAPGASATINLQYTATIVGLQEAVLQVTSNDPATPVLDIDINGIGTPGQFGVLEPSLGQVLRAHDIPTIIGAGPNDVNLNTQKYPANPDPSSEEVAMQRLVVATPGAPVTITPIASFSAATEPVSQIGYYIPNNPNNLTELFYIKKADAQVVDPTAQGATSFSPGSAPFGLYGTFIGTTTSNNSIDTHFSEDQLNVLDATHKRKIRFFPMKTADGTVVPNSFVFAVEDYDDPTTYNSFINFVGIISNVKAAPNAAHGSTPSNPTGTDPAVMDVTATQLAPGSTNLVFNTIKKINTIAPDVVHNTNTVVISNTGNQPLTINSLTLSDTTNWTLVNPPAPGTQIPGQSSLTITIKFIATTNPPHTNNQTNDTHSATGVSSVAAGGVWTGTLTINSSDAINPTRVLNLSGWWQIETEHENEPGFSTLTNQLFGYTTDATGPASTQGTEYPNNGNTPIKYGSEVYPSTNQGLLVAADPGAAVTLTEAAAFHQQYLTANATVGNSELQVVAASETGTTVTITTLAATSYKVGDTVVLAGGGITPYIGTYTITGIPSSTTFTYTAPTMGLAPFMTTTTAALAGWFPAGGALKVLYRDQPNNGQSVFPQLTSNKTFFFPTGAFGLYLDGEFSQESKNPLDLTFNNSSHALRFFPALDANGNNIPNTWIVGLDYRNYAGPNADYQDLFMVLTNATFQSLPATPVDVNASEAPTGANLQWAPVANAVSYNVYQMVNGTPVKLNSSPVTTTAFLDTTAPAGSVVQYRVTSVSSSAVESPAAVTSINLAVAASAPGAPAIKQANGTSGTQVALTWTAPAGTTSYNVARKAPGESSFTTIMTGLTTTSFTDTNVTAGLTYKYEVQAHNAVGDSPFSSPAQVTVKIVQTAPPTPANFKVASTSSAGIVLTWDASSGADSYNVQREAPGETSFTTVGNALTTTTFTDTNATPGITYQYQVEAHNSTGDSAFSASVQGMVVVIGTVPPTPANFRVTSASSAGVALAWDASAGASSYTISRQDPGSSTFNPIASNLTLTTFTDANITVGDTYQYEVTAVDSIGPSPDSSPIQATVPANTPPAPANVMVSTSAGNSVVVTWDVSASATSYIVQREAPATSAFVQIASGLTDNTYTDAAVQAGQSYQYQVIAVNASGGSPPTTPTVATLPSLNESLDIVIGKTAAKSVQFIDDNGTLTTIKLSGKGTATVHFTAATISQNNVKTGVVVSGTQLTISSITTTGTAASSMLQVASKGGSGSVNIGGITADAPLNAISAKTAALIGALSINGNVNKVLLGSVNAGSISVGGKLGTLQLNVASGITLISAGPIQSIAAGTWSSNQMITAPAINSMKVKGDAQIAVTTGILRSLRVGGSLHDSTVILTLGGKQDLAFLNAGAISSTMINATGGLGSISAATLTNSQIYAGSLPLAAFPPTSSGFPAPATIASVTLKKLKGVFSDVNSSIAASRINHVALGQVQFNNNGTPFGVEASLISSLSGIDPTTGKPFTFTGLTSAAKVAADLLKAGITPQDFAIEIV